MKPHKLTTIVLAIALQALFPGNTGAAPMGTAFTYQGRLNDGGNPAQGIYDLRFAIYDSATNGSIVAGPLTNTTVTVSNGLFTVAPDFGGGVFTGDAGWLDIAVRANGSGAFSELTPRQALTPAPYAIMATGASNLLGTLPAAQLTGTVPLAQLPGTVVTNNSAGVSVSGTFTGTFNGSGAGLTNLPTSGGLMWQNLTGTSQQAQPNTGYLANNAAQVTITLPGSPNLGDLVGVSGVGAGGWKIAQNAGQAIPATFSSVGYTNWERLIEVWTEAPWSYGNWQSIASSADGTKLAAASGSAYGSMILTSIDSGATWTYHYINGCSELVSIASSADGTKLAAVDCLGPNWSGGSIYTSVDSGVTWTQTSSPSTNWYSIASSAFGVRLAAGVYGGGIYTSINSGSTWTQTSAPSGRWFCIASSADGTKLAAACDNPNGGIYTSTDSGATWTNSLDLGSGFIDIASSADGAKLAAAAANNNIYTSTDSGVTWTQSSAPSGHWYSIASSADGTKLAAAPAHGWYAGGICISPDSGATWAMTSAPGTNWMSIASSADGTKLAAVVYNGGIWTAQATSQHATTTPSTAGYLTGGQNSAIELQYIGNGQFLPLSHEGTISAY